MPVHKTTHCEIYQHVDPKVGAQLSKMDWTRCHGQALRVSELRRPSQESYSGQSPVSGQSDHTQPLGGGGERESWLKKKKKKEKEKRKAPPGHGQRQLGVTRSRDER